MKLSEGPEAEWTFNPVYPDEWDEMSRKVFIVGPEPNDQGLRPDRRDMGLWFRTAEQNDYWSNVKFFRGTLMQLGAVLREPINKPREILKHLRYLDLKATGGTASVESPKTIRTWVRKNHRRVAEYWQDDKPNVTVLQGDYTQVVFEEAVTSELTELTVTRVGLPHPSRWYPNFPPR